MDDVRQAAEERASRSRNVPVGKGFESERRQTKKALVKQLESQDGRNVHMIAAAAETQNEERILRVAAYCRVSTDDIDQAISINLQIQQYMKKIKENPNWKYAGCYVDDGFSGTNTDHRQGFRKLMRDAMDGRIDMIITKAVSRFARNLTDCIGWVETLQNHDPPIRVFFEQENLDTMSQTSGIILFVLAMVAQEESHMKSEAILLSLEWRFSRGRFITPRLFGYDKVEVPDGFGGKKKVLSVNKNEARVVRWIYSNLVNGASPEEIAGVLTDLEIPTGGRCKNGMINTRWTPERVASVIRNEKHCGDVLARKTYTPNYKDHKSKKNNGKKNKYFQPDHHEAIVSRSVWNAAQRILNSRKYGHEGIYQPMRIIEQGDLKGYISMSLTWAGLDFDDYYRAAQITMGILDEEYNIDLGSEYLPEGGHRIGGLIDDNGVSRIARELTDAEQKIKRELDGEEPQPDEEVQKAEAAKTFQVVNGNMFSQTHEPVISITTKGITFNKSCTEKLSGVETVELLFNPVLRMIIIRPCEKDIPNFIKWDRKYKSAAPLCKVFYDCMGWDEEHIFRIPCCLVKNSTDKALVFHMDNYIGRIPNHRNEVVIANTEQDTIQYDEAKSYYYPPDEDKEIEVIEEKFFRAVEQNKKMFGTPIMRYMSETRYPMGEFDIKTKAIPLDSTHTVDEKEIRELFDGIVKDPPKMQEDRAGYTDENIIIDNTEEDKV